MKSSPCAVAALALIALVLTGSASPQITRSGSVLVKQCDENALHLRLDPGPFGEVVGSRFRLVLDDGKARVLIVVQDCSQSWFEGTNFGPAQYVHVWVLVEGPADVRPVFGAEVTQPTMTWVGLFAGSTNARERDARRASGTALDPIEGVSVGRPGSHPEGRAALAAGLSYSWDVPREAPSIRLLGLNHDVYTNDGAGDVLLKRIQGLGTSIGRPASATLHVVGGADPKPLIARGTYPVVVNTFAPIWIRTILNTKPAR